MAAKLKLDDGRETVFDIIRADGENRYVVSFNGVQYYADMARASGQLVFDLGSPEKRVPPAEAALPSDGTMVIVGGPETIRLTIGGQAFTGRISSPARGFVQLDQLSPASLGGLGIGLFGMAVAVGAVYMLFFRKE